MTMMKMAMKKKMSLTVEVTCHPLGAVGHVVLG